MNSEMDSEGGVLSRPVLKFAGTRQNNGVLMKFVGSTRIFVRNSRLFYIVILVVLEYHGTGTTGTVVPWYLSTMVLEYSRL